MCVAPTGRVGVGCLLQLHRSELQDKAGLAEGWQLPSPCLAQPTQRKLMVRLLLISSSKVARVGTQRKLMVRLLLISSAKVARLGSWFTLELPCLRLAAGAVGSLALHPCHQLPVALTCNRNPAVLASSEMPYPKFMKSFDPGPPVKIKTASILSFTSEIICPDPYSGLKTASSIYTKLNEPKAIHLNCG